MKNLLSSFCLQPSNIHILARVVEERINYFSWKTLGRDHVETPGVDVEVHLKEEVDV
jgi:hypothetical protein